VSEGEGEGAAQPPLLRVLRGEPTADELAALVAVVAARRTVACDPAPTARSAWGHPSRAVRPPLRPAPEGWRTSARPR